MSLIPLPFLSLRTRFMLLAVLLTLGSSAVWGSWVWTRERSLLENRLTREGSILVSSMAIPIINALLYEELGIVKEGGLLDNFVADIMANEQLQPLYAIVVDQEGRVLAHNRLPEFGQIYQDELTRQALIATTPLAQPAIWQKKHVSDFSIALAIAGKHWGALRVGLSREPLRHDLRRLAATIAFFSGLFSAGALGVFYLVGRSLAAPLMTLARQMEGHAGEQHAAGLTGPFRQDEIGLLQESFYRMMERLQQSEEQRRVLLNRMLEKERLSTIGMIVSGVAHEVNNPLAGIQGALYHIEQKTGPSAKRYTDLAHQALERIGRIVGQLLDLSRAGATALEKVNCQDFFEDLAAFARMALKTRYVELEPLDRCPPQVLHLDRDKVHQVILNLILNAADASAAGTRIQLEAHLEEEWYCLEIGDQGPGIPISLHERIFEPFFTTKEPGRGSGMGLAISRSIAESHGGRLELHSAEGAGTVFTLKLPLAPAQETR